VLAQKKQVNAAAIYFALKNFFVVITTEVNRPKIRDSPKGGQNSPQPLEFRGFVDATVRVEKQVQVFVTGAFH
jgi:hypothetical protein